MTGRFLTVEGVEGVGKTTNLNVVVAYLEQHGRKVVQVREPGGTPAGERIRDVLLDPELQICDETELLLMFASRKELVETIVQPALDAGHWVVSDRFTDASFAYQGGGRKLGFEQVALLEQWLLGGLKPDCTLFLDLPVEIGLERMKQRGNADRIEQEGIAFFQDVRKAYHRRVQADPDRFEIIDATKSLDQVQKAIETVLQNQLALLSSRSEQS